MKVAIVGRPNVGKSSLFNVLTKTRAALVHDLPGVTRDVIVGENAGITFMDTAGLDKDIFAKDTTELAMNAVKKADIILFVVDGRQGLHPMDTEWARLIKRAKTNSRENNIFLLVNKCESKKGSDNLADFYKLGFGDPIPVSAEHNIGISEVFYKLKQLNTREAVSTPGPSHLKIAIMGQPNVGKSTLVNRLLREKRVLVRNVAGTTRDVIRVPAQFMGRNIEIIDTAGLRRKSRVDNDIETLAALKALDVLSETDVVVLVLDATKTVEKGAVQLAAKIYTAGKILCVALNKWDLISVNLREDKLLELKHLFKGSHSQIIKPLIFPISAENGTGVNNMIKRIYEQVDISNTRAPTSLLNRVLEKLDKQPPMSRLNRPMKIKFASHTKLHPNVVTINVGGASDIPDSYTRYLRRGISERLGWESIPVVIEYTKNKNPFE